MYSFHVTDIKIQVHSQELSFYAASRKNIQYNSEWTMQSMPLPPALLEECPEDLLDA